MIFKAEFYEQAPLYRRYQYAGPVAGHDLEKQERYPAITMECKRCKQARTFLIASVYLDGDWLNLQTELGAETALRAPADLTTEEKVAITPEKGQRIKPLSRGAVTLLTYKCTGCQCFLYKFAFRISDDGKQVMKIGQYPPWSIEPKESVRKALGNHLTDFKNGLICESQGFGIGAFAYYRRIVELVIDALLRDIEELIKVQPDRDKYHSALSNVEASQSAASRIEVVKDLLPTSLRPGGRNPLDLLHSALSVGLHGESDETCLDWAEAIRTTLVYLIEEVSERKRTAREYEKSIDDVLGKLQKAGQSKTDVK
jgi:hypothetical protein